MVFARNLVENLLLTIWALAQTGMSPATLIIKRHATWWRNLLGQEPGLMDYSVEYKSGINIFYIETWLARKKAISVEGNDIFEPIIPEPEVEDDAYTR